MAKRALIFYSLTSILLLLSACSRSSRLSGYENVGVGRALEMIGSDAPPFILDVRTPPEFSGELGHIPGARLVPLQDLKDSLRVLMPYKNQEILVVCRTGRRSTIASKNLEEAGFTKIYNLAGGMVAWNREAGASR